jgi:hypothetical protein
VNVTVLKLFNVLLSFFIYGKSSSPDSMNTDRNDKSASGLTSAMYKLIVPLLRCEVVDIRDAAVSALGLINHDALK